MFDDDPRYDNRERAASDLVFGGGDPPTRKPCKEEVEAHKKYQAERRNRPAEDEDGPWFFGT